METSMIQCWTNVGVLEFFENCEQKWTEILVTPSQTLAQILLAFPF